MPMADPAMLCGMDNDEIAVMLAKFNLLLKYPEQNFIPDIRCCDFLQENGIEAFDCIVTNPPWGAAGVSPCCLPEVRSGESFSLFFVKAFSMLKPGGTIRFLLPDAVMNVKKHQDLRKFLLEKCRLEEIMRFSARFSGVTSGTVGICCSKSPPRRTIRFSDGKLRYSVERQLLQKNSSCCFTMLELADAEILRAIRQKQKYTLADSRWALGIVTGSNREKLFTEPAPGLEKIYTGREVLPYVLAPHRFYIRFDRQELQQTAPEEYYRASEKLVYKFISSRPVFAYDNSRSLFLNSANILIPDVPGMSIKTVLAFLNSELFAYYCRKLFGDVKILKGDLMQLPFPEITADENRIMETLAEDMLNGADVSEILQEQIYRIFGMTPEQISRIRQSL